MFSPRVVLAYLRRNTSSVSRGCGPAAVCDVTSSQALIQGQSQSRRGLRLTARSLNLGERHAPSPSDKKMLVWAKMYKSIEEVPKDVSYAQMRKARDMARIRVNLWMAAATVVTCVVVISYAKSRQGSGDSLQSRGLKWERDMQEKGRQERELKVEAGKSA